MDGTTGSSRRTMLASASLALTAALAAPPATAKTGKKSAKKAGKAGKKKPKPPFGYCVARLNSMYLSSGSTPPAIGLTWVATCLDYRENPSGQIESISFPVNSSERDRDVPGKVREFLAGTLFRLPKDQWSRVAIDLY